ncbi:MAG: hypothetical protein AUK55_03960 [Syntrophobacteraceae bacterium CG2_30_61_12]|nr:MAG: hypothetical protein AUK55_03960 [Syntrophobacteraceae bacterium CG2_30_61_12]
MAKREDADDVVDSFDGEEDSTQFESDSELDPELDFDDEELIEDEEDATPSVLFKGANKPKSEDEWRQLLLEASREGVPEYLIGGSYAEGDLLMHPKFGLGVVSKILTPRKMEVVFDLSKKLMVMGIAVPEPTADQPPEAVRQ